MSTAGPASNMPDEAKAHSMDAMDHGMSDRMTSSDLELPAVESGSHATTACWRKALDNVVPACVVLKYGSGFRLPIDQIKLAVLLGFLIIRLQLQSDADPKL